jgi:DNA-directed RNA polymerase subunit RPC12/RpoP
MEHVKCVKCGYDVEINIAKAIDEEGEVFRCPNCGFKFRYTDR